MEWIRHRYRPGEIPAEVARRRQQQELLGLGLALLLFYAIVTFVHHAAVPWFLPLLCCGFLAALFRGGFDVCPRCRWMLHLKKDRHGFEYTTPWIPRACPSCGLDLEKPWPPPAATPQKEG